MNRTTTYALIVLLLASSPAAAYIGPGAGISFIGSLFSTLAVFLLALGAVLFWPVRYAVRRLRKRAPTQPESDR